MRKLVPVFIVVALLSCSKKNHEPVPENPVTKKIEYHIFAAKDYSSPVYAKIKADLRLQIRKINFKTGETQLLWDSVFITRNITDFPQYVNKIIVEKFYAVYESKEKLNGSYSVKYDDDGYISQEAKGNDVVPGEISTLLEADL